MKNLKIFIKRIALVLIPLLVILGVISILINKSFYFTDFKKWTEVRVSSENNDGLRAFLDKLSSDPGKSYINYETGIAYLQYSDNLKIKALVEQSRNETLNIEVKEVIPNNGYILENYVFFFLLTLLLTSAVTFYIVFRNRGKITFLELGKLYIPYLVSYLFSTIIFLGLLSLVSRIYFITELEFIPIYFINLLLSILFFSSIWGFDKDEKLASLIVARRFFAKLTAYSVPFLITVVVIIPATIVSFGLGISPFWISFLVALIVTYFSVRWIYHVLYLNFDLSNLKGKFRRRKIGKDKILIKKEPALNNVSRPSKTKSKKKKKRRNK